MRKLVAVMTAAILLVALAAPAVARAPRVKKAKVGSYFLRPGHLTVKRGTKVVWHWVSGFHNVTVKSGPVKFHSANKSGGTYSHVFTKKGTYHLFCSLHPWMKETIVVR